MVSKTTTLKPTSGSVGTDHIDFSHERSSDMNEHRSSRDSGDGFILGLASDSSRPGFGFSSSRRSQSIQSEKLLRHQGATHAIVFAGTGSGKFVNVVAPNILGTRTPEQLFVIDIKGEIAAVTARYRRTLGEVHIVDPFGVVSAESAQLNPLDIASLPGFQPDDFAETLAREMFVGHESRDNYWTDTGSSALAGLIASAACDPDPARRSLLPVLDAATNEDVVFELAKAMDEKRIYGDFAKKRVAELLQIPDGSSAGTRACVISTLQTALHPFHAHRVRNCLLYSAFQLKDVLEGTTPMTVYFVLPAMKAAGSHRGLLRLWLTTILIVLTHRRHIPALRTRIMIDEAAALGRLDVLPMMHTYLRGFGVELVTAWQSVNQLSSLYEKDWRTIVENCGIMMAFGLHATAVESCASLFGVPPHRLKDMEPSEAMVSAGHQSPEVIVKADYRTNLALSMHDPNPYYKNRCGMSR